MTNKAKKSRPKSQKPSSPPFLQRLKDSPIQRKFSIAFTITGVVSLLGLAASIAIVERSLRSQLLSQAESELSVLAINYNIKVNQMAFGFRGQSENTAIIAAAETGKSNPTVSAILANEAKVREIEISTLVNSNKAIVEARNVNQIGTLFNPNGLVDRALISGEQLISTEEIAFRDLAIANPLAATKLGSATTTPSLLIRYAITPVRNAQQKIVGVLIAGDVVGGEKTAIGDRTNQTLGGGFSAITVANTPILSSVGSSNQIQRLPQFNLAVFNKALSSASAADIANWQKTGGARLSHLVSGSVLTQEDMVDNRTYTFAAAPLLNFAGEPVGTIVRGVGHEALNNLISLTAVLLVSVSFVSLLIGSLFIQNIVRWVTKPMLHLEQIARQYLAGNFTARAEVYAKDELGVLAEVMNQMAANIQESTTAQAELLATTEAQSFYLQEEVGHLLDIVSDLEAGDLTVQARVSDQATGLVADTLNRLIEQLAITMTKVLQTAQQVASGAESLEALATVVAQNAQQQAHSVQQARLDMENVNQLAQSASAQVLNANVSVESAQIALIQGQGEIANLTDSIQLLQQGTMQMVQRIKTLGEFVDLAKQFVQDQKRLASLTQVLAMNASMVAARAVEQKEPDQFATVAREFEAIAAQVNNLATQTNQGLVVLQQRTGFIEIVVSGIDQDVRDVNNLVAKFTTGVDQSSQSFANIKVATEQVAEVGRSVTQSSQAIAIAVRSSFNSIQDIATVAERSASQSRLAREQSSAIGELASSLLEDIQFFQLPEQQRSQVKVDLITGELEHYNIEIENGEVRNGNGNNGNGRYYAETVA